MGKTYLFLVFFLLPFISKAQSQTDNWFFGIESGIKFTPQNISLQERSSIQTLSGCASFSNYKRELLFYTNGETVWNSNHEIMENGDGLSGEIENTQNSVIVPKPGSSTIYYLFTTRRNNSSEFTAGVRYSEIEISTEYPLGKVISKNAFLDTFFTEKITAIYSEDGNSIYVITFGTEIGDSNAPFDTISTYTVTSSGVSRRTITKVPEASSRSSKGMIKASPDGKIIAIAIHDFNDEEGICLLDFNKTNGEITFRRRLSMNIGPGVWCVPYGLEFSQNSQILYYSGLLNSGNNSILRQTPIRETGQPINIAFSDRENFGNLQLASNGKIYIGKTFKNEEQSPANTIAVINSPEIEGLGCNYQRGVLNLTPMSITLGVPNFITNLFQSKIFTENQCYVDPFTFRSESYTNITNIDWDFGDGNTANGLNVTHRYTSPGNYIVEAILSLSNNTKTSIYTEVTAYELPVLTSGQELVECDDDTDGITTFNLFSIQSKITNPELNEDLFFYLSQDDLTNDVRITNPENFQNSTPNQEIFVKVVNENGCFETTSFTISSKFVQLSNIQDFFACEDSDTINGDGKGAFDMAEIESSIRNQLNIPSSTTLSFFNSKLDAQTNTNPIINTFISASTTLFVKGQEADLSCAGIQSFNVIVNSPLPINLQNTYTICYNPLVKPPVTLFAGSNFNRFEWRNDANAILSTSSNFTLTQVGNYSLTVYKTENGIECSNSKRFTVINPEPPTFSIIDVNTEDETNNIVTIAVNGNSTYEFSLDNINYFGNALNFTFTNVDAGLQTVYVRDINNCEQAISTKVSVIGFKKYFTPNGDGENDYWTISGLDASNFKSVNVQIFDRFGKNIFSIIDFNSLGWDGNYNGKPLIENNYWYKATIVDNDDNVIQKSGNFSLLRN